jgi:hypothetical protein
MRVNPVLGWATLRAAPHVSLYKFAADHSRSARETKLVTRIREVREKSE